MINGGGGGGGGGGGMEVVLTNPFCRFGLFFIVESTTLKMKKL